MSRDRSRNSIPRQGRVRRASGLAVRVGTSYGRAALARPLGLGSGDTRSLVHAENARRILETAAALRGPFMKVIQLLGMQGDMVPEEYLDALSTLHDKAPPLPWFEIRPVLEAEFGRPPEQVFGSIHPEPLAAASLGQVYGGTLPDGTPVAIKVQYPGVREAVEADLRVIRRMLKAQKRIGTGLLGISGLDYDEAFADLDGRLQEELDYQREGDNIAVFRRIYRDWSSVVVPRVHREFSTGRVLTMDLLEGHSLGLILRGAVELGQSDRETLRIRLMDMVYHEYYGVGVIHADPHPGNKLMGLGGEIGLVDFGCVKVFPRRLRDLYRDCIRNLIDGDDDALVSCLTELGLCREGLDPRPALEWWKFQNRPLLVDAPFDGSDFDFGKATFNRLSDLMRHGYMHMPPHALFTLRGFLGIVATGRMLGKKTTLNFRRHALDYFHRRLAEGDQIRRELEASGLIARDEVVSG